MPCTHDVQHGQEVSNIDYGYLDPDNIPPLCMRCMTGVALDEEASPLADQPEEPPPKNGRATVEFRHLIANGSERTIICCSPLIMTAYDGMLTHHQRHLWELASGVYRLMDRVGFTHIKVDMQMGAIVVWNDDLYNQNRPPSLQSSSFELDFSTVRSENSTPVFWGDAGMVETVNQQWTIGVIGFHPYDGIQRMPRWTYETNYPQSWAGGSLEGIDAPLSHLEHQGYFKTLVGVCIVPPSHIREAFSNRYNSMKKN